MRNLQSWEFFRCLGVNIFSSDWLFQCIHIYAAGKWIFSDVVLTVYVMDVKCEL